VIVRGFIELFHHGATADRAPRSGERKNSRAAERCPSLGVRHITARPTRVLHWSIRPKWSGPDWPGAAHGLAWPFGWGAKARPGRALSSVGDVDDAARMHCVVGVHGHNTAGERNASGCALRRRYRLPCSTRGGASSTTSRVIAAACERGAKCAGVMPVVCWQTTHQRTRRFVRCGSQADGGSDRYQRLEHRSGLDGGGAACPPSRGRGTDIRLRPADAREQARPSTGPAEPGSDQGKGRVTPASKSMRSR
jgi:hypothetical protein